MEHFRSVGVLGLSPASADDEGPRDEYDLRYSVWSGDYGYDDGFSHNPFNFDEPWMGYPDGYGFPEDEPYDRYSSPPPDEPYLPPDLGLQDSPGFFLATLLAAFALVSGAAAAEAGAVYDAGAYAYMLPRSQP
jgi:hypothetical protein